MDKKSMRLRRAGKTRARIRVLGVPALRVFRSSMHMYAQVYAVDGKTVLVAASTVEKEAKKSHASTGNQEAAGYVGRLVAERALAKGITHVAFDRSGFRYHGRVKALADAARAAGMQF